MLRGGKSRSRKQRGGAPGDVKNIIGYVEGMDGEPIPFGTEEEKQGILADIQQQQAALAAPAVQTPVATAQQPDATAPLQSAGGKRKGRKATKKGGDMGAGLLTAGTLLLIQAAAKSLLAKAGKAPKTGRRGRPQRGGQPIESRPAVFNASPAFGGEDSLVQSKLMGGSMCGAPMPAPAPQQGGKKKTQRRSKKQSGGAVLNTSGELEAAFQTLGSGMHSVAYDQAATAAVPVPPFQITGGVSQEGGKKKTQRRSKKQSGGAALNVGGELEAAFAQQSVAGAIPLTGAHVAPSAPGALTALHPQTGGRKRRSTKK